MNQRQIVQRGKDATAVLENEAFKAAMQGLKATVVDQWKRSAIRDKEGQVLLLQLARLADEFEGILIGMMDNGKVEQNKIDINAIRDESRARNMLRKVTG